MKKLVTLSLVLILVSVAASAQKLQNNRIRKYRMEQRFNDRQLTRPEMFQLRKDQFRYKIARRRALRDGYINPRERRRLVMMKRHERRQQFIFRHNGRRRVI